MINQKLAIKKDSPLNDNSYALAVRVVRLYNYFFDQKREYVLSKQALLSGTQIEANITEANVAIFKNDYYSKMSIAYVRRLWKRNIGWIC